MHSGPLPTSDVFCRLLIGAPDRTVTLAWISERLDERSFGAIILLLALMGLVPGLSMVAAPLLMWVAVQMLLSHPRPVLPRFVIRRAIPTRRFARLIERTIPALVWLERFIRPRWTLPFPTTERLVGGAVMLLGLSLFNPLPFSHVVPAIVILGLALGYLEKDGLMLLLTGAAAVGSLAFTGATLWAAGAAVGRL